MADASFQVLYFEVCPAKTKANFVHGFFIKYKELHKNRKIIEHNNYFKMILNLANETRSKYSHILLSTCYSVISGL